MTRAERVSQAVNALLDARAATDSVSEPASMTFLIYEDNGGAYHWTIVADGGERLVLSAGFASYEQAEHAAEVVHRGAAGATFEPRSDNPPADLPTRRDVARARDRLDAERWLDEGGSFSSPAVTG